MGISSNAAVYYVIDFKCNELRFYISTKKTEVDISIWVGMCEWNYKSKNRKRNLHKRKFLRRILMQTSTHLHFYELKFITPVSYA